MFCLFVYVFLPPVSAYADLAYWEVVLPDSSLIPNLTDTLRKWNDNLEINKVTSGLHNDTTICEITHSS